jgi:hypothetical protein
MEEFMIDYFDKQQKGEGMVGYAGLKHHGNGNIFSSIFRFLKPALHYIKQHGLTATSNIAKNMINGENFKLAARNQLLDSSRNIISDGLDKIDAMRQRGKGVKRKKSKSLYKVENVKKGRLEEILR